MSYDPKHIAVLIDGDNAYLEYLERVTVEASKHGTVAARHVYGSREKLDSWMECIRRHGFEPTYAEGQNVADKALADDATKMLRSKEVDRFCIVTSDNDFVELAKCLRKEGAVVVGIGASDKDVSPFKRACNDFTHFEELPPPDDPYPAIREFVHDWEEAVKEAVRTRAREDGWAFLSDVGNRLKDVGYDLDPSAHCHGGPMSLIGSCPEFEVRMNPDQTRLRQQ